MTEVRHRADGPDWWAIAAVSASVAFALAVIVRVWTGAQMYDGGWLFNFLFVGLTLVGSSVALCILLLGFRSRTWTWRLVLASVWILLCPLGVLAFLWLAVSMAV